MLAACDSPVVFNGPASEISDAVTSAVANLTPVDTAGRHLGFDTYTYPGDAAMLAWRDESVPYEWVGYYLEAPCHKDDSWSGKRDKLTQMGWGLAVIYVGQQTWGGVPGQKVTVTKYVTKYVSKKVKVHGKTVRKKVATRVPIRVTVQPRARRGSTCDRQLVSGDRGTRDGNDAIAQAQGQGFPDGTVIFLDIERMDFVPTAMRDYYRQWTKSLLDDGHYLPGFYAHTANAALIHNDVSSLFLLAGHKDEPPFWISGGKGFSTDASAPEDVGHAFANVWQGVLDVARTHEGFKLPIDINVARFASPSMSQPTE